MLSRAAGGKLPRLPDGTTGQGSCEQDHHQQYLHKVPNGYCGLGGTGISCPVGVVNADG